MSRIKFSVTFRVHLWPKKFKKEKTANRHKYTPMFLLIFLIHVYSWSLHHHRHAGDDDSIIKILRDLRVLPCLNCKYANPNRPHP